jgi:hypothetical protein
LQYAVVKARWRQAVAMSAEIVGQVAFCGGGK